MNRSYVIYFMIMVVALLIGCSTFNNNLPDGLSTSNSLMVINVESNVKTIVATKAPLWEELNTISNIGAYVYQNTAENNNTDKSTRLLVSIKVMDLVLEDVYNLDPTSFWKSVRSQINQQVYITDAELYFGVIKAGIKGATQ